jgi:hypothetical protein
VITSWSTGTPEANMDEEILVALRDLVARHPWWAARAAIVVALLEQLRILPPATVLEAGCGWGTNLEALEAAGYRVTGLDVSRRVLDRLDRADRQLVEADLSQGLPDHLPTVIEEGWPADHQCACPPGAVFGIRRSPRAPTPL